MMLSFREFFKIIEDCKTDLSGASSDSHLDCKIEIKKGANLNQYILDFSNTGLCSVFSGGAMDKTIIPSKLDRIRKILLEPE